MPNARGADPRWQHPLHNFGRAVPRITLSKKFAALHIIQKNAPGTKHLGQWSSYYSLPFLNRNIPIHHMNDNLVFATVDTGGAIDVFARSTMT